MRTDEILSSRIEIKYVDSFMEYLKGELLSGLRSIGCVKFCFVFIFWVNMGESFSYEIKEIMKANCGM